MGLVFVKHLCLTQKRSFSSVYIIISFTPAGQVLKHDPHSGSFSFFLIIIVAILAYICLKNMCVLKYSEGNHPIELASLKICKLTLRDTEMSFCYKPLLQLTVWSSICQGYNLVFKHLFDLILCSRFPVDCFFQLPIPPISEGIREQILDLARITSIPVIMIY